MTGVSFFLSVYMYLYTSVQILVSRGNGLLEKLHNVKPIRANSSLLRRARRVHQIGYEWAIGRLCTQLLRQAVDVHIAKDLESFWTSRMLFGCLLLALRACSLHLVRPLHRNGVRSLSCPSRVESLLRNTDTGET
jgi:hypothetical protein